MQDSRTALLPGQQVEARSEPWVVAAAEPFGRVTLVTLSGIGDDNRGRTARLLSPFDVIRPIPRQTSPCRAPRRCVLRRAAAAVASAPAWEDCWTAARARIDLHSWQVEPARRVLGGATRILLADPVGLGKTIQAGLVLSELVARGLVERALILTPATLRAQWAAELADRFRITASILDHASLAALTATLPVGVNPWLTAPIVISSIDLAKRPEVRRALDETPLDLLIVDEAHHLTPGTDRGALVADLAARAPWVVLATATPHSGDEPASRYLRSLGAAGTAEPPLTFRRTAPGRPGASQRRTCLLGVRPTAEERMFLDAVAAYTRALSAAEGAQPAVGLVASVIARRAASSAAAAGRTLARRRLLLAGSAPRASQPPLPWEEGDDDELEDGCLGEPGLSSLSDEVTWLEKLVDLAGRAAPLSSKIGVVRRLVRRTAEPVLVFSEYRDVVEEVARQIADLAPVAVMHGGVAASARAETIRAFTDGRTRVLVATDAAGEGINLQARCRLVVNLELPWSPVRLEQRVGRVDRLGQQRRVHALHLFHRGSFEDVVLAHLERRRARAASATAETAPGGSIVDLERERRLRALSARSHPDGTAPPLIARGRHRPAGAGRIVMLFGADVADASGRLVQRLLVPLSVHPMPPLRRLSNGLVRTLTRHPAVTAEVGRELRRQLARVGAQTAPMALALEQRIRDLEADLERRVGPIVFQGSLFDHRSERRYLAQAACTSAWRRRFADRRAAAHGLRSLRLSDSRLIAAWLAG